jgi:hypothetical protein
VEHSDQGLVVRFDQRIVKNGKTLVCCLLVDSRPDLAAYIAQVEAEDKIEQAVRAEAAKKTVNIYLSSRGWGDYSACEWTGDITRTDAEILAECRTQLQTGHDVDRAGQGDDEILSKITIARTLWATKDERRDAYRRAEAEDIRSKIESGYCFSCGTWCHGDCGHYSRDPATAYRQNLKKAQREFNYGIND